MSEGNHSYLYFKDEHDLFEYGRIDDLEEMASRLIHLGYEIHYSTITCTSWRNESETGWFDTPTAKAASPTPYGVTDGILE
ncbi:hypothetical protein ACTFRP_21395 [Bacillus cereus group sp. MYBK234-1]|uniref:hypothetical protein n=1 Tax=unclassified Bacillus cereus group TaxID=2750818 RepID=UPI003F7A0086